MDIKIDKCGPVGLTKTQNDYFDTIIDFKNRYSNLVDGDALGQKVFHRMFHVTLDHITKLTDAELSNNFKLFEKKMNILSNQIESGKIASKLGRTLWTTQELAERNPIMAQVYDNFVNTSLNYKGRILKSDNMFKDILGHLKTESIQNSLYSSLTKRDKYGMGKSKMEKVVKEAQELQERYEEYSIDAENGVPGAHENMLRTQKTISDYLINGEGKIFNDFVNLIEVGLPKLAKEINIYNKKKWELQEKSKGKVWQGTKRKDLLNQIKSKVANLTIESKEVIDGREVVSRVPISGNMQAALIKYVDYTTTLHKVLKDGVDAYVDGVMLSIESQYSPSERVSRVDKLKDIKKVLKENLTPDEKVGYFPHFRIDMGARFLDNLMPNADKLVMQTMEGPNWSKKGIDKAIQELETYVSNRLKARDENVDPMEYSRNFPAVLKRYASEVNRFNNVAFVQKYTREALAEVKNIYKKGKELDGIGEYFVDMVEDMNQAMLGTRDIESPEWNNVRQTLLGLEYMSKLGWNFRTATKNATQGLLNWVFLGPKTMRESKDFYERKGQTFENDVRIMMEEAGLSFKTGTPELQEAIGSFKSRQIVRLSEGLSIEFKKPSFGDKAAQKVANFAGKGDKIWHPSFFMQKVENFNRMKTFKVAYSKMYQSLEASSGFREWVRETQKGGESQSVFEKNLQTRARNYAIRMTNMLHFDYADISKSKLLRHPLGRFVFQFQHYAQKFFELNKKALYDDLKLAGAKRDLFGEEVGTATRMGMVYAVIPALISGISGMNVFNLVEHATFDKFKNIFHMLTGNEEEIKQASFGRGAVGTVGFPLLSDILTIGEITRIYEHDEDSWLQLLTGFHSYREQDKELRLMKLIGIINTQLKRSVSQTWPLIKDGHPGTALQFEAGLYPDKDVKKLTEAFYKQARTIAPDLAEYYEDTMSEYNRFIKKSKSQERRRYYRAY
tara:strand:+ start:13846 stop:16713 length:2868 start_codon:yes stop_codon:yes gene_type:complete